MRTTLNMAKLHLLLLPLLSAPIALAAAPQSLASAISSYPDLSNFTYLLNNDPAISAAFQNNTGKVTVLVPSDTAFANYQRESGHTVQTLDSDALNQVLRYHILNATVKSQDLTQAGGAVVGTQLTDKMYNNKGKWSESNAKSPGQVVYISAVAMSSAGTVQKRDDTTTASVSSGGGAIATMKAVDGVWDGGSFQIVDHFFTLPINCTDTMTSVGLTGMTAALEQTGKADAWNAYEGITCLAPASSFANNTDTDTLANLLSAHTIKSPQYTPQLHQGQVFHSDGNTSITVTVRDGMVWFGDARVVRANVITNNGVIHVLDKAITPNATAPSSSSSSTPSGTSAPTSTPTKQSLANPTNNLNIAILVLGFYLTFAFA